MNNSMYKEDDKLNISFKNKTSKPSPERNILEIDTSSQVV